MHKPPRLLPLLLLAIALAACAPPVPTLDPYPIYTLAASTIEAKFTLTAHSYTPIPSSTPTVPTPFPTRTPPPTASPTLPWTPAPTLTPTETPLPPTPTQTAIPCSAVRWIADVTIQPGTIFLPNTLFTKTWRLQNTGLCAWDNTYALVLVSGHNMGAQPVYFLPAIITPGQIVDLPLDFTAPENPGNYTSYWQLRDDTGVLFPFTGEAPPFSVQIKVVQTSGNYAYDFAINFCLARWASMGGELPCPGQEGDPRGFVYLLDNPRLENRNENEFALWTRPNNQKGGWIAGVYPPYIVQEGDRFRAWVGCLDQSAGCSVTFQLDYQVAGGTVKTLGQWREEYDGVITEIDLDLTALAGKSVTFTLTVFANNNKPDKANAFWFVPRLER